MISVNVSHVLYTTKVLTNQLIGRIGKHGQKAGLIITSSVVANRPMPGYAVYSATKCFDTFIAEALNYEFKDKVDVLSYRPASVDSLMNPKKKNASGFITSDEAAVYCLSNLGRTPMTHGYWGHELSGLIMSSVGSNYFNNMFYSRAVNNHSYFEKKRLEEEAAKKVWKKTIIKGKNHQNI